MAKSIKFKKQHGAYQPGDGASFPDQQADDLVKSGVAAPAELPVRKGAEVPVKKEAPAPAPVPAPAPPVPVAPTKKE